eukprot:gene1931-2211_t
MTLQFVKMHAHGDDFIVIDRRGQDDPITAEIARRLGDRHRGIGFNQLAVVLDCTDAAARIKFWNPNGTPLDTCGSATRGVADMLMREAGTATLVLRTNRGLLTCVRESAQRVSVDMGPPSLGWEAIPLAQAMDTERLPLEGNPAACSMGNPHCTFFVDDLATVDIAAVGPSLETHPYSTGVISACASGNGAAVSRKARARAVVARWSTGFVVGCWMTPSTCNAMAVP